MRYNRTLGRSKLEIATSIDKRFGVGFDLLNLSPDTGHWWMLTAVFGPFFLSLTLVGD